MKKIVYGAILLLIVIVLVSIFDRSGTEDQTNNNLPFPPETISVVHVFEQGTHSVAGEVELPTTCHTLDVTATVMESFPEQVRIEFVSERDERPAQPCAQVITRTPFDVSFDASNRARISATFNGNQVELNEITR